MFHMNDLVNIFMKELSMGHPLPQSLNAALAASINLKLQAKQAHWNIRGANFMPWHELLDKVAGAADEAADALAERNVQIGHMALGLTQHLTASHDLSFSHSIVEHVHAVVSSLRHLNSALKTVIKDAQNAEDDVSADLATSLLGDMDKLVWFITAHEV